SWSISYLFREPLGTSITTSMRERLSAPFSSSATAAALRRGGAVCSATIARANSAKADAAPELAATLVCADRGPGGPCLAHASASASAAPEACADQGHVRPRLALAWSDGT